MKKSVLMICYYFAPHNGIGAVRPTKLGKYLTRLGYEVTVLCAQNIGALRDTLLERDLAELPRVITVRERSLFRWWKERGLAAEAPAALPARARLPEKALDDARMSEEAARAQRAAAGPQAAAPSAQAKPDTGHGMAALRKRALNALYLWLFHRGDMAFARACTRELLSMDQHFDVALSCYGPLSTHIIGRRAKRLHIADRWVADFRDETSVPFRWQAGWLARYMRRVRRYADAITVATDGFMRMMKLEAFARVVPNGYDPEDTDGAPTPPPEPGTLALAYCGQLYEGKSDLTPVFRALRELASEGVCDPARLRLHYAGRQGEAFAAQAAAFGLAGAVVDHGMLPRTASLALQRAADALLLATWNTPGRTGVVTGKALEYMMAARPVLLCVSGTVPGSEARALIEDAALGVAYEQARAQADAPALKAYLRALYEARMAGDPPPFHPKAEVVESFAYGRIAATFADIIDNV